MGSGFGRGENRSQEAAQEAISSPLLDNVSIGGAQGVLINITGGMDLAIDEVTQISTIIQQEAGDDAEIIFGAVHDPALEEQVRVTVIATGFDQSMEHTETVIRPEFKPAPAAPKKVAVGNRTPDPEVAPFRRFPERVVTREQLGELDIPTFIRRQMD